MRLINILLVTLLLPGVLMASKWQVKTPMHVTDVELMTLKNEPTNLIDYGKRHMMVFYIDPDARGQNKVFQEEMRNEKRPYTPNIAGYTVLNLADTKLPGGMVRMLARIATKGTETVNLVDMDHTLRDAWNLGEVDNQFVVMFVTKEGELVYYHAGELSREDMDAFYAVIDKYK